MTFPKIGRDPTYRAVIPALSGGINKAEAPFAVKDHQTTEECNLWWKNSALCTRPGLRIADVAPLSVLGLSSHVTSISDDVARVEGAEGRLLLGAGRTSLSEHRLESLLVEKDGTLTSYTSDVTYSIPIQKLLHIRDEKDEQSLGTVLTNSVEVPLLKWNTNGTVTPKAPYIPTILLQVAGDDSSAAAEPSGYSYESRNMLTDAFRMECVVSDEATYYHLPSAARGKTCMLTVRGVDAAGEVVHTVSSGTVTPAPTTVFTETTALRDGYRLRYDQTAGTFWFVGSGDTAVSGGSMPYTALTVTFEPFIDNPASREVIRNMRFGMWFGGDRTGVNAGTRYFVAGNPDFPHRLHYSGLSDATYFPENNYVTVGSPAGAITALRQQGNMLVIFKEHELYVATYASSTVSADDLLQSAVIDVEAARAAFPLTPVSARVGCDCPDSIALCGNRLVWATSDGAVYTLHSAAGKSERNLRELSTPIAPLLKEVGAAALKTAFGVDFDGWYGLFAGSDVFLFHYDEQSFYAYSSYDASDRPGKILAWHVWKLPADFAYTYAFAGGDAPLLIGFTGNYAVSYRLDGEADEYYPQTATAPTALFKRSGDVTGHFCTKLYDFGAPDRKKQIKRLTLYAEANAPQSAVTVTYLSDRGTDRGGTTVRADEWPLTLHPNGKRVRRFGVRCDVTGAVELSGLSMRYAIQN